MSEHKVGCGSPDRLKPALFIPAGWSGPGQPPIYTAEQIAGLFTIPQPAAVREPLTYEQITEIGKQVAEGGPKDSIDRFVRAIEAAHGITGSKK